MTTKSSRTSSDSTMTSQGNNKPVLIGFEIEGAPCKVSIRNVWLKKLS